MRYLTLTLHKDFLGLFSFLETNPTRAERKGDYYRFIYREPLSHYLTPFRLNKLWLEVTDELLTPWQVIRDHIPAYAGDMLLNELYDLERHQLAEQRQGVGLVLTDWLLEAVCYGIATKQGTARLVRAMFVTGYDMEQVIGVFSTLTQRLDLSGYFLQELTKFYGQEVVA